MSNADRLKTATRQPTMIAAAFEAGRVARRAGKDIYKAHPTLWPARLRRAFMDGFYTSNPAACAPASWSQR
jgi:hypothetical protein